jgi:2,3-bisphosphoglycerate-independent phosphoglycerate mutase
MKTPTTLIILDGYGLAAASPANAISRAETPVMDKLLDRYPHTQLTASGTAVGLPDGQAGNSEVGHLNIGAGRVVYQDISLISHSIQTGDFFTNPAYTAAVAHCRQTGNALHLMGLLSDGGVHSHNTHMWAFLDLAKRSGLKDVYIHCFTDGRDTSPTSGKSFIKLCQNKCAELGVGKIATVCGRFYAMDRDSRWDRVELAYNAIVCGEGKFDTNPIRAIQASYDVGITDEFIQPIVCSAEGRVKPNDAIIFINFRPDRAREITRAFVDPDFSGFHRKKGFFPVHYVCTTQYAKDMPNVSVAYPPETIVNTLGDYISSLGLTQLRAAETEKYAHVTFFFNGGVEQPSEGEDRILVHSPKDFPTYDQIPEMSAYPLTEQVCTAIRSGKYDFVLINFANCDMVGHTGNLNAAIRAVEVVDECLGKIVEAVQDMGGAAIVTSDHGNAEEMTEPDGITPHTAHSTNPVPFIVIGHDVKLHPGILANIAPTILDLMGYEKPVEMTSESLIVK